MDFFKIRHKDKKGVMQAYPDWIVGKSRDLMVKGGSFYAIWNEHTGMWSTDEFEVQLLVDDKLMEYVKEKEDAGYLYEPLLTGYSSTGSWDSFQHFLRGMPDNSHPIDEKVTFADTVVKKTDFVSRRLPYSLEEGKTDAWDELLGVLYAPKERDKIEWCIGAVFSGDSKWIQKFLVLYGPPATGKSTILNIVEKLFEGYTTSFEAKALASSSGQFAMEVFRTNPLVAIQHDGDLSRVEDNSRLNSITAHDNMTMNIKYQSSYTFRVNAFLFMGTNKPVRITDAKAGTTRRLIDVHPTGARIEPGRYHILMQQVEFELGAIAHKCLERYHAMGRHYYESYMPTKMMMLTDTFYNFIEAHFDILKAQDGIQVKHAWDLYKQYCEETNITKRLQYHEVRDELGSYFREFHERYWADEKEQRSYYMGFKGLPESGPAIFVPDSSYTIELGDYDELTHDSAFNRLYHEQPAQLAKPSGFPGKKWDRVTTLLRDIDTTYLHYVQVPEKHIVLDFDLVDEDGEKDIEQNLEAASKLPPTYAELSQSGKGIHLHYIYAGDVSELASVYEIGIEIKTLLGDSSLRRKLTKCNTLDIATISGGLPKKERKMLELKSIKSEKGLRELIERNLRKDVHPGTKPSVDFIWQILEDAYNSDLSYDVRDMRPKILAFAAKSTNHSSTCIKTVLKMQFVGKSNMVEVSTKEDQPLIFFDVEVYPNLFILCWKTQGSPTVVRMINPTSQDIEPLFKFKLVGFNNRRYDNHIIYARYLGYSLEDLFRLSQKMIVDNNTGVLFGEAYNISYTDIYDFSSKKQGLKKFEIELGIHHMELDLPYDQPVPEGMWGKVEDYCANDVIATEAVFEDRKQDFVARQILAELSGLSVNHTTQQHTARIIFGDNKHPQEAFVYTDLSKQFKGYRFDGKESTYRGETPGEGGYVYSEPGIYSNVTVLDIASMHPASIEQLNLFGPYTIRYSELKQARLAIKRKDYEGAANLLGGKLAKFLDESQGSAEALSYALKIVINIVYGLTSARFDNAFRDYRNVDNIVAKRGALFMIDLKHEVQKQGFRVVHIKTDSIKIPDATPELIEEIVKYGAKWGYEFELETTYDKFCLVNDAVYIAREFVPGNHEYTDDDWKWTAVGAQFQHPYVFKQLFSLKPLVFDDFCETKNVMQGTMYLDMAGNGIIDQMVHVGRTGSFVPVSDRGGALWRVKDEKLYAVTGTKGYKWIERETARNRQKTDELHVDMEYFEHLRNEAISAIEQFGSISDFVGGE